MRVGASWHITLTFQSQRERRECFCHKHELESRTEYTSADFETLPVEESAWRIGNLLLSRCGLWWGCAIGRPSSRRNSGETPTGRLRILTQLLHPLHTGSWDPLLPPLLFEICSTFLVPLTDIVTMAVTSDPSVRRFGGIAVLFMDTEERQQENFR